MARTGTRNRRRMLAGTATLLITVVGILFLAQRPWRRGEPEVPTAPRHGDLEDGLRAAGTPPAPSASAGDTVAASRAPVAEPPSRQIRGHVLDVELTPIPDADVALWNTIPRTGPFSPGLVERAASMVAELRTDHDGSFAFEVPNSAKFELRARAEGFAPEVLPGCYAGQEITVVLTEGAVITGRILDAETRQGVPDVPIRGWRSSDLVEFFEVRSDATGLYAFRPVPSGTVMLEVMPQDFERPRRAKLSIEPGQVVHRDFLLARGTTVHGHVADAATGEPVSGAQVSAGSLFWKSVRTDGEGNYRLRGAPGAGVPDIRARAPGYATARRFVEPPTGADVRLDFALERAGSVRGRVLDVSGHGLPGVLVAAKAFLGIERGIGLSDRRETLTEADGRFVVDGLDRAAHYSLLLYLPGYSTKLYDLPGPLGAQSFFDLGDLQLGAPAIVKGRVTDRQGQPLAGIAVVLAGHNKDRDRFLRPGVVLPMSPTHFYDSRSVTGADGMFMFTGLSGGSYTVKARIPGMRFVQGESLQVGAGSTDSYTELQLDVGECLSGVVVSEDGSALPSNMILVCIEREDGRRQRTIHIGTDGRFEVVGLESGSYALEAVVLPSVAPWIGVRLEDVPANSDGVTLKLRRASFLGGQVVDADGAPVSGVVVVARSREDGRDRGRVLTDSAGEFRLRLFSGESVDLTYGKARESERVGETLKLLHPDSAHTYEAARGGERGIRLVLE